MSWEWQKSGNGYLECRAASTQLRYAAISEAKVIQFAEAVYEPEIQAKPLPEEGVRRKLTTPKIKITEVGRAMLLPPNYVPPKFFDIKDPVQKHLVWQMRNALDHCSMGALKLKQRSVDIITSATTLRNLIPRAKWTGIEALCSVISGYMTSRAEPYDRTYYVGIGGVRLLRSLKHHPKFLPWKEYLREGEILFAGESGATPNIRWVEINDTSLLKNEGVVFGHEGLLLREVQTPHLRLSEEVIAWYGVLAFGGQNVLHIPERKRAWA